MGGLSNHRTGMATEYQAAAYYTSQGYTVCWPKESQSPYDFIVEKDGTFKRVQVKTPSWILSGKYSYLQSRLGSDKRGGHLTTGGCKYKSTCDEIIFICKESGDTWVFPIATISHTSNVCLATTNPNPNRTGRLYNPDDFKIN